MFTTESANKLAYQLVEDWNSKELDAFLDYFTDDVELISTNVQRFVNETNGQINGKETLRNYWIYTKDKFPYFKYKLNHVDFDDNKLILRFHNSIDNSFSNGIISFNSEIKIYKMLISYV